MWISQTDRRTDKHIVRNLSKKSTWSREWTCRGRRGSTPARSCLGSRVWRRPGRLWSRRTAGHCRRWCRMCGWARRSCWSSGSARRPGHFGSFRRAPGDAWSLRSFAGACPAPSAWPTALCTATRASPSLWLVRLPSSWGPSSWSPAWIEPLRILFALVWCICRPCGSEIVF